MAARLLALDQLDQRIQRWIWEQNWTGLRDAQERAIEPLLEGRLDVIIAAATASGKTEAAFFPILTRLAREEPEATLAVYISPLKALINDQWGRLDRLCERLDIPVIPWHGDITADRKKGFLRQPHGVLLITPESLEAMFVRRGTQTTRLFASISHLVIDELHAFIGSDRGKQLQSLLSRIEAAAGRRIPRVGLSATLGDMSLAAEFLRPGDGSKVEMIVSSATGQELKVQVRGYVQPKAPRVDDDGVLLDPMPEDLITEHLFKVLRGTNNLIFPNSRNRVELYADRLRRKSEEERAPLEFWPHHGSLSKATREETEKALKDGSRPATGVCTTTLELGIDIGAIRCVAQIGAAPSVASLRQRLGRSGRRKGEPAILRGYEIEDELDDKSALADRLRAGLIKQVAQILLLMDRWFEPPRSTGLHLSTLVQQILSIIAERSGIHAKPLYDALVINGAFQGLPPSQFASLLRAMAAQDLLVQDPGGGELLPGQKGEAFINSRDFYAAFVTDEEWTLASEAGVMGTLPIDSPVSVDMYLIFGGRRWQVTSIDAQGKRIQVRPAPGGMPPIFGGSGGFTHRRVRERMREILEDNAPIPFLDETAAKLVEEARAIYREFRLDRYLTLRNGAVLHLIPWAGDDALTALVLLLKEFNLLATSTGLTLDVSVDEADTLFDALEKVRDGGETEQRSALAAAENLEQGKWDWVLPRDLLEANYASLNLDFAGAREIARQVLEAARRDREQHAPTSAG